jgi:hypothetical protein
MPPSQALGKDGIRFYYWSLAALAFPAFLPQSEIEIANSTRAILFFFFFFFAGAHRRRTQDADLKRQNSSTN